MVGINVLQQVSRARNGVGAFVFPCKRIILSYCNFGGSSAGMRDFLRLRLKKFAQQYPEIEFRVVEKPGQHPIVKGEYSTPNTTGNSEVDAFKQICVRKWNIDVIENKLKLLVSSSGKKLSKPKHTVISTNPSVRGIWSPFYVDPNHRFKI
jgi:large subunit ribosomal protein L43